MSQDSTINAVANGGSPQPVKTQESTPTNQSQIDAIASEVIGDEGMDVEEAAIDAATKTGDLTKQEAKELKKRLKLKIDGREEDFEVPEDEEELKKHFQKSKAFDKRLKDFSTYEKQVESMLKLLQDNPEEFLERAGLDVDKIAEGRIRRKVEELEKSPEQLKLEKMQKELEKERKEKEELKKARESEELEKLRNEQAASIENEISEALSNVKTKLPKNNAFVIQKIAQNMLLAMRSGYPNVSAKDVIPIVEKQWREELRSYVGEAPADILEDLIGKDTLDKYRKSKIAASRANTKTTTAKQVSQDTGKKSTKVEEPKEKRSFRKMFSYHDEE